MNYAIAQTSPSSPTLSQPTTMHDWGIAIAILLFIVKIGIDAFKSKEAAESALTKDLIDDLRAERRQQWQQMGQLLLEVRGSNRQIAQANLQISKAIADINLALQQGKRSDTEIFAALRNVERHVDAIAAKMDAESISRSSRNGHHQ